MSHSVTPRACKKIYREQAAFLINNDNKQIFDMQEKISIKNETSLMNDISRSCAGNFRFS